TASCVTCGTAGRAGTSRLAELLPMRLPRPNRHAAQTSSAQPAKVASSQVLSPATSLRIAHLRSGWNNTRPQVAAEFETHIQATAAFAHACSKNVQAVHAQLRRAGFQVLQYAHPLVHAAAQPRLYRDPYKPAAAVGRQ